MKELKQQTQTETANRKKWPLMHSKKQPADRDTAGNNRRKRNSQ